MKTVLLRIGAALIGIAGIVWLGDFVSWNVNIPRREPLGTVTVRRYYAIGKKANKVEYVFDSAQDRSCVNSLFPHFGQPACWYLRRHAEERISL